MLQEILEELHNWFEREVHVGDYSIEGGTMELPYLQQGQYFRIVGSVFNDGLHRYPCYDLQDEDFIGKIVSLAVPQAVIDLAQEAEEWSEKHAEQLESPYKSESFGGYTYTLEDSASGSFGWREHFAGRLNAWRKI